MHVLDELEWRGFIKQCSDLAALREAMDKGPVTVYCGFDPTASSLHVGNMVPALVLAHLQRAGHRVVAVVGGGTGMVGDPSGKTEARMLLTPEVIQGNLEAQQRQLSRFLDFSSPDRGLMVNNADWLLGLGYIDFLREIGSCFSVNKMLTAEGYRQRMEKGLSFLEFNYQLLQAYDFLVLNQKYGCTLQIGGDDQWGNILAGVDLIRRKQASQAFALTQPLLLTSSGQKMGKTHAGAVWIDANRMSPFDFFQYWVNTDDRDVVRFLKLYTFLSAERIAELEQLQGADIRLAKGVLAWEITALLHGEAAANEARDAAVAMVAGAATDDLPTFSVAEDALQLGMPIFAILADSGIAKSRSEGRRLIQGGAVRVGNDKVSDPDAVLRSEQVDASGIVVRVGKKHAVRVVRS